MKKLSSDFILEKYGIKTRLVNSNDAKFILSLRTDKKLSRFLHDTDPSIEKQKKWISDYKLREQKGIEYYFIFLIEDEPFALQRLTDVEDKSFTSGSWISKFDTPFDLAVLTDIITFEIGFEILDRKECFFDVRKGNSQVLKYQKLIGADVISEDELDIYFKLENNMFSKNKSRILKLIK